MRVLLVGDDGRDGLAGALGELGLSVEVVPAAAGGEEGGPAALAGRLRAFERLLADGAVRAVLVGSASDDALAAILVASKLSVPTARLESPDLAPAGTEINRTVIAQLADAALAPEPQAVARWLHSA
jgi:UDP-N-acetylglucosamine 2-epimerase